MWECSVIQTFWARIVSFIYEIIPNMEDNIDLNLRDVMFNLVHKSPGNVANYRSVKYSIHMFTQELISTCYYRTA